MNTAKPCLLAGSVLLLTTGAVLAQSTNQWFVTANAGASLVQDDNIRNSPFGNTGSVRFNTGFRGGLDLGYRLKNDWAAELESGAAWNSVHSIAGNVPDQGATADFYQIPVLAKLVYTPWHGKFQPFASVGVGAEAGIFDMSNVSPASSIGIYSPSFHSTAWAFAYQAELGFNYRIAKNWDAGLTYSFLGTMDHNWSANGVALDTSGSYTHAIEASLTWHF